MVVVAAAAVAADSSFSLSFLKVPMKEFLSSGVWKRPWPNLDDVSMNLRLIFSKAAFLVCTLKDWNKFNKRFNKK